MIWDLIEQSTFDKYFSDPTTTITTLLLDENIITELKNQNPKLLQYLNERKHQLMTQLIQYTITMPKQIAGPQRCHKLPYVSSELLAMDSELIYGQFFKQGKQQIENAYWSQLLTFLDSDAAQNEILMGYFQKIVNNLYAGNKIKTTLIITQSLKRFSKLLPNGSIADILKKSLVLLDTADGAALTERKTIVNHIINLFAKGNEQTKSACSDILSEVIKKFQAFSSGEALLQQILNSKQLLQIYSVENSIAINEFLVDFITKSHQKIYNQHDQSVPIIKLPELHLAHIQEYLKREIVKIGIISKSIGFIVNQNKQTVRKSNKSIYSLLQLVGLVIEDKMVSFVDECFLNFLWNIIILYPYNNILQVLILKIFTSLLQSSVAKARETFLNNYEAQLMNLAKNNFTLLKQLIFTIWKAAKQFPSPTSDPNTLSQFQNFVKTHLEPLLEYQVKSIQHTHNTNKKLIVDEEDRAAAGAQKQDSKQTEENYTKVGAKSYHNAFFDSNAPTTNQQQKIQNKEVPFQQNTTKQKDEFDSFNDWSPVKNNNVVIEEQKGKKGIFDDFANFI